MMSEQDKHIHGTFGALQERARELDCLYEIEGLLKDSGAALDDVLSSAARTIPAGWQHPEDCRARITVRRSTFQSSGFQETPCIHRVEIFVGEDPVGAVEAYHAQRTPGAKESPFPPEKRKLIDAIAKRLGQFLSLQQRPGLVELHPTPDREDATSGDQGSADETGKPGQQETEYRGLCVTCVHSPTCAFLRRTDQRVLSCEEFDYRGTDQVEAAAGPAASPAAKSQAQISDDTAESSQYKGLCATCGNRNTCMFPRPEDGVWHCGEFL